MPGAQAPQRPPQPSEPQALPEHFGAHPHALPPPGASRQVAKPEQLPQEPPQPSLPQDLPAQLGAQQLPATQTAPAVHDPQLPPAPSGPQVLPAQLG